MTRRRTPDSPPPLLIAGHGTRSSRGVSAFESFVERVGKRLAADGIDTSGGFIELSAPPLTDAVGALVGQGHRHLVAVPLVLVAAGHGKGDIPGAMQREQQRHPGLTYSYGRRLGPHPTLLSILESRIDEALAGADRADTTIVLVGRGSTDPDANAEVAKVARLLWEGRGYAGVEPAFISLAGPSVPEALERARLLGGRRIVVAPYFLFPGLLPDRVAEQSREYAAEHPELDIRIADLIGDCDELAELVVDRYHEAIGGDIRMNCDTCIYRIALPGHENRVGAAQTPHDHPHDPADPHHHHHHPPAGSGDLSVDRMGSHAAASLTSRAEGPDLRHHGDAEVGDGLVDLAVNVRMPRPPGWLTSRLIESLQHVAGYPDPNDARAAVAARHDRAVDEVLLTAGAAEAFVLLARVVTPRRAVVVHPQFTEPEAALRAAGHEVERVVLPPPFELDPERVPDDADLVLVGNPTNPTSVLHPAETLAQLAKPGRTLVVDEAFADCVPGEPESFSTRADLPGVVVVRSLTKTWSLAGLRVGYLLADPATVARLRDAQPLWPVSTPALAALEACTTLAARAGSNRWAHELRAHRNHLQELLAEVQEVDVVPGAQASFLLLRVEGGLEVRAALRARGFAVRRGDTFPGLGPDWLRVAVRDPATSDALVHAIKEILTTRRRS